jgi:hypothetical protein
MRSNQIRNRNLGIQLAHPSAKAIVRREMDRPSMFAMWCASTGSASRLGESLRGRLQYLTLATRIVTTRVTGGALQAVALQRSRRHGCSCCPAAR